MLKQSKCRKLFYKKKDREEKTRNHGERIDYNYIAGNTYIV